MYTFKEDIDNRGCLFISKKIIIDGTWAKLSLAGKTVLPVIIKYRNEKGIAFPSQETIAILAGVSEKTVSCGIKNIEKITNISAKRYWTTKGNISYKYFIPSSITKSEARIRINNTLFGTGCWRMLSSSGKALYIVLRTIADCDESDYEEKKGLDDSENNMSDRFKKWYGQREYDIVAFTSKKQLAELSGISRPSINKAVESLRETGLLEDMDEDEGMDNCFDETFHIQKIYINPEYGYDQSFLNSTIEKSFRHKQQKKL